MPVKAKYQREVYVYRPMSDAEVVDRLVFGKTECDWKKDL